MATDHTGKNKHQRTGRVPPHGVGEPVIDSPVPREQEPPAGSGLHGGPPDEYKRERTDVPGLKKKIR